MVKIYSIEGNIGSGKSTLIREMKKKIKGTDIVFVLEPVDEWDTIQDKEGENILTKFYNDQAKYAFSFQMMAYISRLAKLKRIIRQYPTATIITERSVLTDKHVFAKMLYDDNKIEKVNYIIYLKWFDEFIEDVKQDGFIYLDVGPKTCHDRVLKRGREGETISLSYLQSCDDYHKKWLSNKENVLVLEGNDEFENDNEKKISLYQQILKFIEKKYQTPKIEQWNRCQHC